MWESAEDPARDSNPHNQTYDQVRRGRCSPKPAASVKTLVDLRRPLQPARPHVLWMSQGGLRRIPAVACLPMAVLQWCDLVSLTFMQILAAGSAVAKITEPSLVSTALCVIGGSTAPGPSQLLELRRADAHLITCTVIGARSDSKVAKGPLVPADRAFVQSLPIGAPESHIKAGRACRGGCIMGKAGFPCDETCLGTVAASVLDVAPYGSQVLVAQIFPCRGIGFRWKLSLADAPVSLGLCLPD